MIPSFFRQPHPLSDEWKSSLGSAALAGFLVALFLIVFQPFGTYNWQHPSKYLLLAGYGFITFTVILLFGGGMQRLFPRIFNEENWTVGHEVLFQLMGILAIAILNYFYSLWLGNRLSVDYFRLQDFLYMVWATLTIGLFPTLVFTALAQYQNKKRFSTDVQLVSSQPEPKEETEIRLMADNGKDSLRLLTYELRYISAADNYVEIHFVRDGIPGKMLLRGSLSRICEECSHIPIMRCHRSYLVYGPAVHKVSGNAQGYKLHFQDHPALVPVGRSYTERVMEKLNF